MKQEYKFSFADNGAIIEHQETGMLYVAEYTEEANEKLGGLPMENPDKIQRLIGSMIYEDIEQAVQQNETTDFNITVLITPQKKK